MSEMTVKDIVADWLKEHGYGGLGDGDECYCVVDDIFIAGDCDCAHNVECHPLYAWVCKPGDCPNSGCMCYPPDPKGIDVCLRAEKPPKAGE